jgi:SAM-dependent methyltransferase
MDARLVWDTWRRILTTDALTEKVLGRGPPIDELSMQEAAVLAEYARTPRATATNIGMYRNGLGRNALAALALVPMSRQLLFMSGEDVDAVADSFVAATGYADYGPRFWKMAGDFVAHLAGLPAFSAPAQQDALALDAATTALARRLAAVRSIQWPETAAKARIDTRRRALADPSTLWEASLAAVVVASRHDLAPWLEEPAGFDPAQPLEISPRRWLVYFPSEDAAPAYAELSERSARLLQVLARPATLAEARHALGDLDEATVRKALASLAELGVVLVAGVATASDHESAVPEDSFVMLDSAVERFDPAADGYGFLIHDALDLGMVVPPGDGLQDFLQMLVGAPVAVGALREAFDDQALVDRLLAVLTEHGFVLHTTSTAPSPADLALLRLRARASRQDALRPVVDIDLDARTSAEQIRVAVAGAAPPELILHCRRLADHQALLAKLARRRRDGVLRLHRTVLHVDDLVVAPSAEEGLCRAILQLGAVVVFETKAWPAPDPLPPGAEALARRGVEIHAMMTPDETILLPETRAKVLAWVDAARVTGLRLRLEPERLWARGEVTHEDFLALFEAVGALEDSVGDVQLANLPDDEVLLGKVSSSCPRHPVTDVRERLRRAYVRWRLPILRLMEGDNTWSQTPEAEAKVVIPETDLLPSHPELLGLRPGGIIVDVCGGLGRVARRLAPAVGADGLVISIEMFRCLTDQARRVACARNVTNISFRTGLAQRLPLPDGLADAAVNEWTAGIWELGLGAAMVEEMARVVRPGGRVAVTHRLTRTSLARLDQPWVQFPDIHAWMHAAFAAAPLRIVDERIWGQISPSLVGEYAGDWRKQYIPRLASPFDAIYDREDSPGPHADVYLTLIAERA